MKEKSKDYPYFFRTIAENKQYKQVIFYREQAVQVGHLLKYKQFIIQRTSRTSRSSYRGTSRISSSSSKNKQCNYEVLFQRASVQAGSLLGNNKYKKITYFWGPRSRTFQLLEGYIICLHGDVFPSWEKLKVHRSTMQTFY